MRTILWFILISFATGLPLSSQNPDSLKKVADTAQGKHLSRAYGDISAYYWKRNPQRSMEYAQKAKAIAEKYPNDTTLFIEALHLIGDAHYYNNNPANALEYALKVLNLQEKINDSAGIAKSLNNLGVIYSGQKKYEKALEILERSLDIRKKLGNSSGVAANYNNIGQIYHQLHEDSTAMHYFKKSVALREQEKNREALIGGYNNIAAVYMRLNDNKNAIDYLNRALAISDSLGLTNQKATIMYNLGDIFHENGDTGAAKNWYKKSLTEAQKVNKLSMILVVSRRLSNIYEEDGNLSKALAYSRIVSETKDSIHSRNTNAKIEQLQYKYDARETELENKTLKQQNELSQLKLTKERTKINLLIILAILSIVIIALLINRYTLKIGLTKHLKKEIEYRTRSLKREISERKRLDQENQKLHAGFNSLFNNSPLAIVSVDEQQKTQIVNNKFLELAKQNKTIEPGTPIANLIEGEEFSKKLENTLNGENQTHTGKLTFTDTSKTISAKIFFNPYKTENEQGAYISIEDISKNIEAEEKIKLSRQRFRELADLLPEMLIETDLKGMLLYANKEALSHFGFSKKHIERGLSVFDMFNEENRNEIKDRFLKFTSGDKKSFSGEFNVNTHQGDPLTVHISVNIVHQQNQPARLRAIIIDITQRKKHEEELIRQKEKAENADNLKSRFLQNLSHEIRTPMNGILGFSELMKHEEMTDQERENYIDFIINSTNKLLNIIDDVVNISKIEAGDISITENEVSLTNFFNDMMVFYHGYLMNRNDKITLRLQNKVPEYNDRVIMAEKQVQHVLSNLIYNAIKFTKEGYIEIIAEKTGTNLKFTVKDTGIGIPGNELNKIFDRFYQVHDKGQESYGGTGLGLTIAKGLVEMLGGEITVNSTLGKGAEFSFIIPWTPAEKKGLEIDSASTKTTQYPDWSDKNILVAEDDMNNYLFLEQLLLKTKATVHHVTDGKQALEYVQSKKAADIILMDIQMPVMDGYEATKQIRKINAGIPILAQTANAMVEDKSKSLDAGCDDYVAKPVNKKVLLNKIGTLMQNGQA